MDFDTLQTLRETAGEFLDESDFRYYEKREEFHTTCPQNLKEGLIQSLASRGWQIKQTVPNVRKDWDRLIFHYQSKTKKP